MEDFAYFINEFERDEEGNYIPCIAKKGEKGFYKTDWNYGKDLEVAREAVDELNERIGLDKKAAFEIVCSTII